MPLTPELQSLPPAEKIELVADLWDSLAAKFRVTLPLDELREVRRRREELASDPGLAIDADELWHRLDGE